MVCNWGLSLHWLKWDLSPSQRSYCRWKTIKIFIFHRYLYCVYKYAFLYWNIFNYGKEKKFCIIGCVKFNQICIHSKKESIFQYWPKLIEHLHGNAPVWSSSLFEIATSNFKCRPKRFTFENRENGERKTTHFRFFNSKRRQINHQSWI